MNGSSGSEEEGLANKELRNNLAEPYIMDEEYENKDLSNKFIDKDDISKNVESRTYELSTKLSDSGNLTVSIETDQDVKQKRIEQEERRAYKHRFLHTACVCCSMFALGWRNALVGPTFPDLRQIINEDLSTASWILTAISFGGLIGSVLGGMAYDRFNKTFVFVFIMCGLGGVASLAPWCSHFIAMFIVHVFHGAFASALDTAATADVTVIWRHKAGPFMQAIHGTFSVGAIISPFICEPFLAKKIPVQAIDTNFTSTPSAISPMLGFVNDVTHAYDVIQPFGKLDTNLSATPTSVSAVLDQSILGIKMFIDENVTRVNGTIFPTNHPNIVGDANPELVYGQTYIYIPYFMATFVCLVAVSLYFILYLVLGNVYEKSIITPCRSSDSKTPQERKYFLNKRMKIVFTVLVALSLATYVISERCFVGFLMTFIITKVGWSKSGGSMASSVFWIAFATGRLSGILIVKWIKLSIVIMVFFSLILTGAVLMWTSVVYNINALVWVSIAVVGYGMSVIFASMFSWLSENVRRLTGKMASILFIFLSIGAMVFPILEGYLMDKVSQMWFIYSLLILSIIMILIFIIVIILFNILQKVYLKSKESTKQHEIKLILS